MLIECVIDGYGTLWVLYWRPDCEEPVCCWLVPGTINPLDD